MTTPDEVQAAIQALQAQFPNDPGNPFLAGQDQQTIVGFYHENGTDAQGGTYRRFCVTFRQGSMTFSLKLKREDAIGFGHAVVEHASQLPTDSGLIVPGAGLAVARLNMNGGQG